MLGALCSFPRVGPFISNQYSAGNKSTGLMCTLSYFILACTGKLFQWYFLVAGTVPSTSDALDLSRKLCTEERNRLKSIKVKSNPSKRGNGGRWGNHRAKGEEGRRLHAGLVARGQLLFTQVYIFLADIFHKCWCFWVMAWTLSSPGPIFIFPSRGRWELFILSCVNSMVYIV